MEEVVRLRRHQMKAHARPTSAFPKYGHLVGIPAKIGPTLALLSDPTFQNFQGPQSPRSSRSQMDRDDTVSQPLPSRKGLKCRWEMRMKHPSRTLHHECKPTPVNSSWRSECTRQDTGNLRYTWNLDCKVWRPVQRLQVANKYFHAV